MEYYKLQLKINDKHPVGICYNPNGDIFVGANCKLLKHLTTIVYDFFKLTDSVIDEEKTGIRQKNRFRYYAKIKDKQFREGLKKLSFRYTIVQIQKGIGNFT